MGKRPSGSKTTVFVPSQRQWPPGWGVSFTGTVVAASSCEVTATIGCEKVTLSSRAIGTWPCGEKRTTSNGPDGVLTGGATLSDGGKEAVSTVPGGGGGRDRPRK